MIFLSLRFCPKFCFQILRWNFGFSKQRSVCTFPSTLEPGFVPCLAEQIQCLFGLLKMVLEFKLTLKHREMAGGRCRRKKKKELHAKTAECSRSLRQSELAFLGPSTPPPPSTLITDLALTYRPHFRHQVGFL